VGKRKEDIVAEVQSSANTDELKSDVQALRRDLFYSQNPQYKGLEAVIAKFGTDPAEAVNSPEFKNVFEKVQIADGIDKNKSVIHSNARLSETKTIMEEAVAVANSRGTTIEDVATVLARQMNKDFGSSLNN
jgi:hypothetical protein